MDLALLVYAISLLHGISSFFGTVIAAVAVSSICMLLFLADSGEKSYYSAKENASRTATATSCKTWLWRNLGIGIFSAWVLILLPSEKTAYTMVGAYAAQRVAENEKVQHLSSKVLTIIEQRLDGFITEGVEKAEKAMEKSKK